MDLGPPGSSVHGVLQARMLERAVMLLRDPPDPGVELVSAMLPVLQVRVFDR